MWTVQQSQAGIVYVLLFGVMAVIALLMIGALRYHRGDRAMVRRALIVVLAVVTVAVCYFLAMWFLTAKVYH